jgi:hypothetical protein
MKTLIAASLLLVLAAPAYAGNFNLWECGKEAEVTAGKSMGMRIYDPNNPHDENSVQYPYPTKGKLTLEWDHSRKIMRLNGKACRFIPDKDH